MAEDKGIAEGESNESSPPPIKKKGKGVLSRIWNAIFRIKGDDFEKKLQYISKEEASLLSRMKRRSLTCRRMIRHLIVFSVILEVVAVAYAIMTTRSLDLDRKMRAFRVLPMFLLPAFSSIAYSAFVSITRMCDHRDQKTLERLHAERQAKIDELKEKTNYYTTQQLIQRYDPDPAAKAAAATVLASKLGADSGLKVYVGDESNLNVPGAKSNDVEVVPSSGLRRRKQMHTRTSSTGSTPFLHSDEETVNSDGNEAPLASKQDQLVVDHYFPQGPSTLDGGWLARVAALLVGEDPTVLCTHMWQLPYAQWKEDFPYITYYCPHCHALNRPKQSEGQISSSSPPSMNPLKPEDSGDAKKNSSGSMGVVTSNSPVRAGSEIEEVAEKVVSSNVVGLDAYPDMGQ